MKIPEYLEVPIMGVIAIILFGGGVTMMYYGVTTPPPYDAKYIVIPYIFPDGYLNAYQMTGYSIFPILVGGGMIVLGLSDIVKRIKKYI